mmetsp:Transcript_53975/g.135669  ORF Transcript_53975/g.135669 Transcript_53975/m.135669 type:complete len:143 (-) Transcript_53975:276-704(-)
MTKLKHGDRLAAASEGLLLETGPFDVTGTGECHDSKSLIEKDLLSLVCIEGTLKVFSWRTSLGMYCLAPGMTIVVKAELQKRRPQKDLPAAQQTEHQEPLFASWPGAVGTAGEKFSFYKDLPEEDFKVYFPGHPKYRPPPEE